MNNMAGTLNIVIPLAGTGIPFQKAGYAFPKPLIEIKGKTMIEVVINNLKPECPHRFILICKKEHYEKYDLYNVIKNATAGQFEIVQIDGSTEGAACTVLTALKYIDNDDDLMIANSDQIVDSNINAFIAAGRENDKDGLIMTFRSTHPKWSYVRTDDNGAVIETAEKKVISDRATVGIYYFKHGSDFVRGAQAMIEKNIRTNNEFYVCPVYNELILADKAVGAYDIDSDNMHSLGTPEALTEFLKKIDEAKVKI